MLVKTITTYYWKQFSLSRLYLVEE